MTLSTWDFASATRNLLLNQTESVAGTTTRSWTYGYDPADRLTQALASPGGTYAYTLDAAGNLTGDGTRSYAWDAEQRLMRVGYTGTSRSTTFRYDAFGRRTAVIEQDGSTATETRYLWCGERIYQARDRADTMTRRYYDEGELAVAATGDVATFYTEDHLGSIRDLRMGDGQVLASYDYDPYGNPTRFSETGGIHADYRYAGRVNHAQSGLYLAHFRAYSPQAGRWISRDPIGEAGGVNLYGYVESNPLNFIDPSGLLTWGEAFRQYFSRKGGILPTPFRDHDPGFGAQAFPGLSKAVDDAEAACRCSKNSSRSYSESLGFDTNAAPGRIVLHLNGLISCNSNCNCTFIGDIGANDDPWDFDPRPWGERDPNGFPWKEFSTHIGAWLPGAPFTTRFAGSRPVRYGH